MGKIKWTDVPRPMIVVMVSEPTVDEAIKVIKRSEFDGAQAFIINLMGDGNLGLRKEFLNPKDLGKMFRSTDKPCMVCYYRWDYSGKVVEENDEERMGILLEAVKAGASIVDMQGDLFDETPGPAFFSEEAKEYSIIKGNRPREFTMDPVAIEKQKEFIKAVHKAGGQVQYSCHTRVHLTPQQAVEMGKELESRGPDAVKLVSVDLNWDDVVDTLQATVDLKKHMKVPYLMMSHGEHSVFVRYFAPLLGSMLCFCQQDFPVNGFYLQPILKNVKAIYDNAKNLYPAEPYDPYTESWL